MARGWESKAVEDQIAAAESEKANRSKAGLTAEERDRQARRDGLRLARARILADLESAADARYRALLERALAHVEGELEAVG